MAGQIGNRGGQPGRSGRSSAYKEHQDAAWLASRWVGPVERAELEARIKSGVYGIRDMWLWKVMTGQSESLMKQAADKMLPDLVDVTSAGKEIRTVVITKLGHGNDGDQVAP